VAVGLGAIVGVRVGITVVAEGEAVNEV